MVRLQISISECLHHQTLLNMMFNEILKAHHVQKIYLVLAQGQEFDL
jgi:hypothetical protein